MSAPTSPIAALAFATALTTGSFTVAAADKYSAISDPEGINWADTGPQFPDTRVAILFGDAGRRGPVSLRWRCPDGYKIMAHTHPGTERVTVLQGLMKIGMGKKYDSAALTEIRPGGFFVVPAKEAHFGDCIGDTIIDIATDGPLGTTYVNPTDDPSKKK